MRGFHARWSFTAPRTLATSRALNRKETAMKFDHLCAMISTYYPRHPRTPGRLVPKEHSGGSSNTSEGADDLPSPKSQHFPLPTKASCAFVWWLFGVVTAPAPTVRFTAALRHAQVPVIVVGSRR